MPPRFLAEISSFPRPSQHLPKNRPAPSPDAFVTGHPKSCGRGWPFTAPATGAIAMAASTFSKAVHHNARSHKPWERAENDLHGDIETLSFDVDGTAASAVGSQVSAPAPKAEHTSVAHDISHVALGHRRRHHRPSSPTSPPRAATDCRPAVIRCTYRTGHRPDPDACTASRRDRRAHGVDRRGVT